MKRNYYADDYDEGESKIVPAMLLGAIMGAVAALMMKPENRHKVMETYHDIKQKGEELLDRSKSEVEDMKDDVVGEVRRRARRVN